jgi:maltokinase
MGVKDFDVKARWFAGKGRRVSSVEVVDELGPLTVASVAYADGGEERYLLLGELSWAALLRALAEEPLVGARGRLELRAGRGLAGLDGLAGERVPSTDQTNTLVALGERVLVKAYRRLEPGVHPEVELVAALTEAGAPVPSFLGSIAYVEPDGADTAVALLIEFIPGAEGGWEGAIERVAAFLANGAEPPLEEFRRAGETAARLHEALRDAFPTSRGGPDDAAAARAGAEEALAEAASADAELAAVSERVLAGLADLERLAGAPLQRVHGDLHYAQFLRTAAAAPLVIDFEGDPTLPLAARRRPGSALHDLACLLRSIDHIGSAAARRAGGAPPDRWIDLAVGAALSGYGTGVDGRLLRALELAKELGELVYARRVLPDWSYAPRAGLRRLLAAEAPA